MDARAALHRQECTPCKGGTESLKGDLLSGYRKQLGEGWEVVEETRLEKEFRFPDFRRALEFVNKVGELAEVEGHHPDLFLSWGRVKVSLWTHKINGLHENDFILAAKIDTLY
ncbi:MAG: 4a-hydroxytetrahydrobiopterin dehydratase [Sedimentisphaerales bacterium]|nr:4a-hydroxytetrahydrobiopterin dehydratase [Sedimentisphaerales bacterium]